MVFGLFEGNKINITLDKPSYRYGEEIAGRVVLDLKQPKKAKGVRIELYLQYETMRTVTRTRGRPPRSYTAQERRTEKTALQTLQLDGEKEYSGHLEYPFRFVCQHTNVVGFSRMDGWYLDASLDVPMSVDVGKKVRLNIM